MMENLDKFSTTNILFVTNWLSMSKSSSSVVKSTKLLSQHLYETVMSTMLNYVYVTIEKMPLKIFFYLPWKQNKDVKDT